MFKRTSLLAVLLGVMPACDDGGGDGGLEDNVDASAQAQDAGMTIADAAPPLTLERISGDLTYATYGDDGHLFSVQTDGRLRQRLTHEAGHWRHHAVSVDGERIAAVKLSGVDGPGEIWVIDVPSGQQWALTPVGCDAGIGGVGWINDTTLLFAMSCDGEPATVYEALAADRSRDRDGPTQVNAHDEGPVRDVAPLVDTPFYAYVVDRTRCAGEDCVVKPEIWIAEKGIARCRVTDGDLTLPAVPGALPQGGEDARIGDHTPYLNRAVDTVYFSRSIRDAELPGVPGGHRDLFSIAVDHRGLSNGTDICSTGGVTNLTEVLLGGPSYATADGTEAAGDEYSPRVAEAGVHRSRLLFTVRTMSDGGEARSAVYWQDGTAHVWPLTPANGQAGHGRWID